MRNALALAALAALAGTGCTQATAEYDAGADAAPPGVDAAAPGSDAATGPQADASVLGQDAAPGADAAASGPDAGCSGVELPDGDCQPAFCSKDDFCWVNILPTGNGIIEDVGFQIRSRGDGEAWVRGGAREILHFDGAHWSLFPGPGSGVLLEVFPFPGGVWAFGVNDASHWDGSSWTTNPSGLEAVYANPLRILIPQWCSVSQNEIWLADSQGVLARWDGAAFQSQSVPEVMPDRPQIACSPTSVWVRVGAKVYRRAGGAWVQLPSPPAEPVGPLVANSDSEVWVAAVTSPCTLQRWDGVTWTSVPLATEMGTACPLPSPRPGGGLHAIAAATDGSLIAWTYDGTWRRFEEAARTGDELWDRREFCRWTSEGKTCFGRGKTWAYPSFSGPVVNLVSRAGELWTMVNHKLARFDGRAWTLSSVLDATRFAVSPGGDLWAIATDGAVMHFDGSSWTREMTGPATLVRDLHVTDTATFVLGSDRSLRVRQGTQWSVQALPGPGNFNSVWAASPADVWLWDGSTCWRWDGAALTAQALPAGTQSVSKFWGRSSTNLWLWGADPTGAPRLSQWDGATWTDRTPSLEIDERLQRCDDRSIGGPHFLLQRAGFQDRLLEWTGTRWLSLETGADGWPIPPSQCGVEPDGTIWVAQQATGGVVRRPP